MFITQFEIGLSVLLFTLHLSPLCSVDLFPFLCLAQETVFDLFLPDVLIYLSLV